MDALACGVPLLHLEPHAHVDYLGDDQVPEPLAGLAQLDALALGVQVKVVGLAAVGDGAVVAALVDGLVVYPEWEEPAGGGLGALEGAYPSAHEGPLEDASAVWLVPEVGFA